MVAHMLPLIAVLIERITTFEEGKHKFYLDESLSYGAISVESDVQIQ